LERRHRSAQWTVSLPQGLLRCGSGEHGLVGVAGASCLFRDGGKALTVGARGVVPAAAVLPERRGDFREVERSRQLAKNGPRVQFRGCSAA
jgi:hypothetical protein